jgi:L-glyceraldehyde 3-phosphate reductase
MAQGLLSDKYLNGIPTHSRAGTGGALNPKSITDEKLAKIRKLNDLAKQRGQSLAQMALAWVLRFPSVTSALIGASRPEQIKENVDALKAGPFSREELERIEAILTGPQASS